MSLSAGKWRARRRDEVKAAPPARVLTPQYETFVT